MALWIFGKKQIRPITLFFFLSFASLLYGCTPTTEEPWAIAYDSTAYPIATATTDPYPVATATTDPYPVATATDLPVATPSATNTAIVPVATETPSETITPWPTNTPKIPVGGGNTPTPSSRATDEVTPSPEATAGETATPLPTNTPTPSPIPPTSAPPTGALSTELPTLVITQLATLFPTQSVTTTPWPSKTATPAPQWPTNTPKPVVTPSPVWPTATKTSVPPTATLAPTKVPATNVVPTKVPATNVPPTTIPATVVAPTVVAPSLPSGGVTKPVNQGTGLSLPNGSENLYLIVNGSLVRWKVGGRGLETLLAVEYVAGGLGALPLGNVMARPAGLVYGARAVVDFRVTDDEATAVVLRALQSADSVVYDLVTLNIETGELRSVVETSSHITSIALSADDLWLTYIGQEKENEGTVWATTLTDLADPLKIGSCQRDCLGLFPSDSADSILYSDARGVWRVSLDKTTPPLQIAKADETPFTPHHWSLDNRYLLLQTGESYTILDNKNGRMEKLPNASAGTFSSSISWLQDNRLLILEASRPSEAQWPVLTIVNVNGEEPKLLRVQERLLMPTVEEYTSGLNSSLGVHISAPATVSADVTLFTINSPDPNERGLYRLDLIGKTVQKTATWPNIELEYAQQELIWTNTAESVLLSAVNEANWAQVYYLSPLNAVPYELPFSRETLVSTYQWVVPSE